jgi:hypothetical protein
LLIILKYRNKMGRSCFIVIAHHSFNNNNKQTNKL